ncbi:MAG: tripartite tricarboxylate transporter TctB family protein [Nitrospinae bacterium]|nr:tripartite tricarboxylate transporter TctB family protein [Nitrospinota bacterium]
MFQNHDRVASVIFFIATTFLFYHAGSFPEEAAFYPRMVIGLMIVLSVLMFIKSWLKSVRSSTFEPFFIHNKRFFLSAFMALGYIAGVQYLGYYSASLIFIPAAAWALGYRNRFVMAATTVCYLLFIFVVFDQLFDRPLTQEFFLRH